MIIPNFAKYDIPGFVIIESTNKFGRTYQRDVFIPESFISELESKIIAEYGDQGRFFLYSVGKNFGWNYGKSFNIPNLQNALEIDVSQMAMFLSKFIGGTWAEKSEIVEMDLKNKYFEITFKNYVVCRYNGLGYLLNSGSIAGLWAWIVADFTIEGFQKECQGRKDAECRTICGPSEILDKLVKNLYKVTHKIETNSSLSNYTLYNKIRPIQFSKLTAKELITTNIVSYKNGIMTYNGERYLPIRIELLYLLESQIKNLPNGEDVLFSVAYDCGIKIASNEKSINTKFMSDFMSFQGWGDLMITSDLDKINIKYYPWHGLYSESKKHIFLGILSGFVSSFSGKKTILEIASESLDGGFVSLNIYVKKP